jgi:uncharacterized protein (TIGR02246 family)
MRQRRWFARAASATFVVLLGTATWADPRDEASIRSLPVERWCKAEAAQDLEAKMDLFTADVVVLSPGEVPIVGRDRLRALHKARWQTSRYTCTGTVDEVIVAGDWGFARGSFSGTTTDSSGAARESSGRFINVVRRDTDGHWRVARAIWNAD